MSQQLPDKIKQMKQSFEDEIKQFLWEQKVYTRLLM